MNEVVKERQTAHGKLPSDLATSVMHAIAEQLILSELL